MSVCIAGVCDSDSSIGFVTDEQLTMELSAGDVIRKFAKFTKQWVLMFAGDDTSHAGTVIDQLKKHFVRRDDIPLDEVLEAVLRIRTDVLRQNIEASILAPLCTHNEFLASRDTLGAKNFNKLLRKVLAKKFGCHFLLAGFDQRGVPHIVAIPDGEEPENVDRYGFRAIGSGAEVSTHMLLRFNYTRHFPIRTAMFHLCAAKYMSQNATVGDTTKLFVLRHDGDVWNTTEKGKIYELWETWRRYPLDLESKMPPFRSIRTTPSASQKSDSSSSQVGGAPAETDPTTFAG